MPCPFTGPKMFCAGPNILVQTQNLFTYCASHKHFAPDKKVICIQQHWFLCLHKSFWRGTKCSQIFGLTQKIWTGTKYFGTCKRTRHESFYRTQIVLGWSKFFVWHKNAQNILGPVKGQGIRVSTYWFIEILPACLARKPFRWHQNNVLSNSGVETE